MCRIRKGVPSEARVVARVLPPLLLDFFPAQEIMNKVIGEFLSSQQPHPELMAQALFKVHTCNVLNVPVKMTFHTFLVSGNLLSNRVGGSSPHVYYVRDEHLLGRFVSSSSAHLYSLPLVRVARVQESLLLTVTWEMLVYIDCYFWSLHTPLP